MYDQDRSGSISYPEFRMILKQLGGLKHYDGN